MSCPLLGTPITVNQASDSVFFIPTPTGEKTLKVAGTVPPTVTTWINSRKNIGETEQIYGFGGAGSNPGWFGHTVTNPVTDLVNNTYSADVLLIFNFFTVDDENIDFLNIGIRVDDGVNAPAERILCMNFIPG